MNFTQKVQVLFFAYVPYVCCVLNPVGCKQEWNLELYVFIFIYSLPVCLFYFTFEAVFLMYSYGSSVSVGRVVV